MVLVFLHSFLRPINVCGLNGWVECIGSVQRMSGTERRSVGGGEVPAAGEDANKPGLFLEWVGGVVWLVVVEDCE